MCYALFHAQRADVSCGIEACVWSIVAAANTVQVHKFLMELERGSRMVLQHTPSVEIASHGQVVDNET